MLTNEQARDYVLGHLTELGYEDIRIVSILDHEDMGIRFKKVLFTMRAMDGSDSDYQFDFDVWQQEDGTIYGEW